MEPIPVGGTDLDNLMEVLGASELGEVFDRLDLPEYRPSAHERGRSRPRRSPKKARCQSFKPGASMILTMERQLF